MKNAEDGEIVTTFLEPGDVTLRGSAVQPEYFDLKPHETLDVPVLITIPPGASTQMEVNLNIDTSPNLDFSKIIKLFIINKTLALKLCFYKTLHLQSYILKKSMP